MINNESIDEQNFLKLIIQEKEKANILLKESKIEDALSIYSNLIYKLENYQNLSKELKEQLVFMYSNTSICYKRLCQYEKSAYHDLKIINNYNPDFYKSYARLISTYLSRNKYSSANYWASVMRSKFTKEIISQFSDLFEALEIEKQKHKMQGIGNFL